MGTRFVGLVFIGGSDMFDAVFVDLFGKEMIIMISAFLDLDDIQISFIRMFYLFPRSSGVPVSSIVIVCVSPRVS